ncbi:hypothetical protein TCAL_12706 [Tigriopus californicus]|uniref:RING-type domain-containing protein n=1 Tax=Tigriopus californicus TaxID=6832 RepID=A0A553NXT9_TIGCA|nr:RING finger protein 11-like [Tigriopus californicus]TRY70236.1 hypothetical protein TCAL_12706 [Tigriopus californicus]|eukprot:TCALIF_12706-PA protein Name:"Similar to Rnf11 RING finger protein 11 (Mus musculus)" AED:0.23 eAED:0.24 QI:0/0/0/0.66/1/1/3/0/176
MLRQVLDCMMGNCLKASGADDVSLLREGAQPNPTSDPHPSGTRAHDSLPQADSEIEHQSSGGGGGGGVGGGGAHIYYPSPNVSRPANQLTEEEQVKIAQRLGLIQHLPVGEYDGSKKNRECVICMIEFVIGDRIRYLPCLHIYHTDCIDDWLMRSFTCPSCMEPVDAALLVTYETH